MAAPVDWIERLALEPHPEGGWFRRIYTAAQSVPTPSGSRCAASSIHYLLNRQSPVGRFHRNRSAILHYLQDGGPVTYWLLDHGSVRSVTLGREPGQSLFLEVPGGIWKASRLESAADCALVSEVVLPGFDYADHEFLTLERLQREYPDDAERLSALVR